MAFNLQTFKTRTLTAIVFAIVMLLGLLWNGWSFLILFTVIHFGCWWEFVKLIKKIRPKNYGYYLILGIIYITVPILMILNLGFLMPPDNPEIETKFPSNYFFAIPSAIIFSIWINDTMAYIIGSFIGKTPFSKISPKKTWEGVMGGFLLCVIVMGLVSLILSIPLLFLVPVALISAIFGTLGDLLESKLKRMAGVKDSGSLMPGHGGFLDRFDSLLIATPFVWLYVYFCTR